MFSFHIITKLQSKSCKLKFVSLPLSNLIPKVRNIRLKMKYQRGLMAKYSKTVTFKSLILLFIVLANSAGIHAQKNPDQNRQNFVDSLLPVIDQVNAEIMIQRVGIYNLYVDFKSHRNLAPEQLCLVYKYLKLYSCNVPSDTSLFVLSNYHFKLLLKKIDIIPAKLALAQAVKESEWGELAFSAKGNNLFGILCLQGNCGMTINQVRGSGYYYKSYPSTIDGVRDYMLLLNSGKAFEGFRDLRVANRLNTDLPDPFDLVQGLDYYSVYGKAYINSLIKIMRNEFQYL